MAPNWDTDTRGQNRDEDDSEYDRTDHDALSCLDVRAVGHGPAIDDVESLSLVSDMDATFEERSSEDKGGRRPTEFAERRSEDDDRDHNA